MRFKTEPISFDPSAIDRAGVTNSADITEYLSDESKLAAEAVGRVFLPDDEASLASVLRHCSDNGLTVSVSGGRTGVVGGAVPVDADAVISLDKLKGIRLEEQDTKSELRTVVAGAGVRLNELQEFVQQNAPDYYFPVNPTETWASVGGIVSTNASGTRSFYYGSVRSWVGGLRVVLMDGSCLALSRSEVHSENPSLVELTDSRGTRRIEIPYIIKPKTKNTIGYTFASDSEEVDLFIGAEGTLGVVSEVTLRLCKKPTQIFLYLQFFPDELSALAAIERVRKIDAIKFLSLEFMCGNSLKYFCQSPKSKSSKIAPLAEKGGAAVQFKVDASDSEFESIVELLSDVVIAVGGDTESSFAGFDEDIGGEARAFRHAIPETINSIIAKRTKAMPGLHKLSTDMAVPDGRLKELFALYKARLTAANLEHAIFGHAGDNHLHANIMPRDLQELKVGKELYLEFAKKVVEFGGAVSAEHGIGRIKRDFLALQYSSEVIDNMREIKRLFDPDWLLNSGVIFYE